MEEGKFCKYKLIENHASLTFVSDLLIRFRKQGSKIEKQPEAEAEPHEENAESFNGNGLEVICVGQMAPIIFQNVNLSLDPIPVISFDLHPFLSRNPLQGKKDPKLVAHNMKRLSEDELLVSYSTFTWEHLDYLVKYDLHKMAMSGCLPLTYQGESLKGVVAYDGLPPTSSQQVIFGSDRNLYTADYRTSECHRFSETQHHSGKIGLVSHLNKDPNAVVTQGGELKIWDIRQPNHPLFSSAEQTHSKEEAGWEIFKTPVLVKDHQSPLILVGNERSDLEIWHWDVNKPTEEAPQFVAELTHSKKLMTTCLNGIKFIEGKYIIVGQEDGLCLWKIMEEKKKRKSHGLHWNLTYLYDLPTGEKSYPFFDYLQNFIVTGDDKGHVTLFDFNLQQHDEEKEE